jgi:hypothetical protein
MSYFHKGNHMPLHRNANTPPPKPGYFMVFIYPQVVHSVVFTTIFFVSVVSICTTVTEKKTSHTPHTTPNTHHHHGRRRPRPLPPSVAVHCRFWGSRGGGAEATISRGGGEGGVLVASPGEGGGAAGSRGGGAEGTISRSGGRGRGRLHGQGKVEADVRAEDPKTTISRDDG